MSRPFKARRICGLPMVTEFGPLCRAGEERIQMTLEELETIRLIDLLGCTQEECALQMEVARTTVQAVYISARKKIADCLVNGRQLTIGGGNYCVCPRADSCCGRECGKGHCGDRCCQSNRKESGGCKHETCGNL